MCGEISRRGDKLSTGLNGPIFGPIADEFHRLSRHGSPNDDLPETFAAIGSTLDKTNSQMTSLAKTINKHFAVQSHPKIRTVVILTPELTHDIIEKDAVNHSPIVDAD
jgi:hypothetical protein